MKQDEQIFYVETIEAAHGKLQELKEALLKAIPHAREEKGIISFDLYQDCEKPNVFLVLIRFKNRKAYDDHLAEPYIQEFIEKFDQTLYQNVVEEFYKKIE